MLVVLYVFANQEADVTCELIRYQGHEAVVEALIAAGADIDKQDRNRWSALMWAMTNRHKQIAKVLLDNGASSDAKTTSGRTAADFVAPDSDMSFYLHSNGYNIGSAGIGDDDFYKPGFSQDKFEEELMESELRRRMMMESARDLEVDLGNVGIDDQPEVRLATACLCRDCHMLTLSRSMMNSTRSNRNLTGQDASTTRCLCSKRATWTAFWTSSSQT